MSHGEPKFIQLNFYPATKKYDQPKFEKAIGITKVDTYDPAKFGKVRNIPVIPKYDNVDIETASWRSPLYKHDESEFERARFNPKKANFDKSKFQKVNSIYFVKDLNVRPQEKFDVTDLKCQNRNGLCVSYVHNDENFGTRPPVKNNKADILRISFRPDSQDYNEKDYDDDENSESLKDLTRIGRILDRAHGNVSEDYVDLFNKLLVREHKPEFKLDRERQRQLLLELENTFRKPPVRIVRKSSGHKKRKKRRRLIKPKKSDLNITFTPLKYRSGKSEDLDSDEDNSESDEDGEEDTSQTFKIGTVKDVDAVKSKEISKRGEKNKKNRFNVIDNEKNKANPKKRFKAKNVSNDNKDVSDEKLYKYRSDESYSSSEKLSSEIHEQSAELTTLRPKKKKKKKSTAYMYMQGPQRQYMDSEEESRRSVKALRHQIDNDKNEALRDDKSSQTITKKRVSEDYIDYENYRRFVPMFMPKRYFWQKDQFLDLGYFWFNGPQGRPPGPFKISY